MNYSLEWRNSRQSCATFHVDQIAGLADEEEIANVVSV
jgi:hypothetical protein